MSMSGCCCCTAVIRKHLEQIADGTLYTAGLGENRCRVTYSCGLNGIPSFFFALYFNVNRAATAASYCLHLYTVYIYICIILHVSALFYVERLLLFSYIYSVCLLPSSPRVIIYSGSGVSKDYPIARSVQQHNRLKLIHQLAGNVAPPFFLISHIIYKESERV